MAGPDVVGLSVGFDHDPAGREVRRRISGVSGPAGVVDPGWVLEQAWTAAGRLAATAVPGRRRGYSYDGAGNLLGMDDSVTGPVRYGLDTVGRVSTVTVGSGAGRVEQAYGYDLAGMLTTATPPDGADGVVTVGGDAGSAAQDSGRIELRDALPVQAGPDRFRYDRDGRLAARSRARPSLRPATWKYTWDALDRLTMVRTPDGAVWRYRYDGLGRRVAKQQLTGPGPEAEQVGETRYLWDGPHLVEQLHPDHALRTHPAIGTDQGTDAGRGRPFALTWDRDPDTGTPLTQTVSTWTLPRQRDGADVLDDAHSSDHFDPGTDRGSTWDVDRDVDRAFYAIVTDLIGTPIELRTPDGATAWTQAAATIWGHPNAGLRADLGVGGATGPGAGLDESVDCPLRFPGQYHDPETGLHYNLHRYYNPTTASYLTPDPLGLDATPTPHSYVPNPTTWIDPLGLTPYNSAAAGPAPSRFITTRTGTTIDRTAVNTSISAQRQERHVLGARRYEGSSYFNSADDAQRVLDEFHSGVAEVLGIKGNDIVVRTPNVLGVNVNARAGYPRQVTNVFFIKGTSSPSVVPHNPAWAP